MLDLIKSVVDYAYDNIPLYRKLYQKKPNINSLEDFKNLPYLRSLFSHCLNLKAPMIEMSDIVCSIICLNKQILRKVPLLQ